MYNRALVAIASLCALSALFFLSTSASNANLSLALAASGPCVIQTQSGGPAVSQVTSPQSYQVFQRDKNLNAKIEISASVSAPANCVQARVVSNANPGTVIVPWQEIDTQTISTSTPVTGSIVAPSGPWYQVQIQAVENGIAGTPTVINNVGAGEVFITAGQSNSTFWGSVPQSTATGDVSYFDGTNWGSCQDPVNVGDGGLGGSP